MTHKYILLFIVFVALLTPAQAQKTYSEEEINLEKIFIDANREKLLDVLNLFISHLESINNAIDNADADRLFKVFNDARVSRNRYIENRKNG